MSLNVGGNAGPLFVYSPISLREPARAGSQPPSVISQNAQTTQTPPASNSASGNKNNPDEEITGEKLLSSMPFQKNDNKKKADGAKTQNNLSDKEQEQADKLKKRDAEVKAHEQAHLAAAGGYAKGGPSYTYQTGPDGRQYAVGGEVQIDTSPIKGDPQATIMKAQTIKSSALAPAEPSGQDKAVAAAAEKMIAEARAELMEKNAEKNKDKDGTNWEGNQETEGEKLSGLIDITA